MNTLLFLAALSAHQLDPLPPLPPGLATKTGFKVQVGQELLYRGTFTEENFSSRVQFNRSYRVESRALVFAQENNRWEVACLTALRQKGNSSFTPTVSSEPLPTSLRMEILKVDTQGRIGANPALNPIPLDGPPTLETGFLLEIPKTRLVEKDSWETSEDGRPLRNWKVVGVEIIQSVKCVRLLGVQQTADWEKPRADRQAWQRTDTVWLNPQLGVAQRYERVIEIKEPAHTEPSQKITLRCDLETSLVYPGQLFEDRLKEVRLAKAYREGAAPYLGNALRYGEMLKGLNRRIQNQLDLLTPTPYREAVLQTRKQIDGILKGEIGDPVIVPVSLSGLQTVKLGQKAPDFLAQNMRKSESVRLGRFQGKPVLLIFYNPRSPLAENLLAFAQTLQARSGDSLQVVGMSTLDDPVAVRKQLDDLKITIPVLNGSGLRSSYNLEATPVIVLLDPEGTVRLNSLGWGLETRSTIEEEVRLCIKGR